MKAKRLSNGQGATWLLRRYDGPSTYRARPVYMQLMSILAMLYQEHHEAKPSCFTSRNREALEVLINDLVDSLEVQRHATSVVESLSRLACIDRD